MPKAPCIAAIFRMIMCRLMPTIGASKIQHPALSDEIQKARVTAGFFMRYGPMLSIDIQLKSGYKSVYQT